MNVFRSEVKWTDLGRACRLKVSHFMDFLAKTATLSINCIKSIPFLQIDFHTSLKLIKCLKSAIQLIIYIKKIKNKINKMFPHSNLCNLIKKYIEVLSDLHYVTFSLMVPGQ